VELRSQGACKPLKGNDVERLLEGCSVAVDSAVWLHEAQCQSELVKHFGKTGAAVKIFFERCTRFLRKGILPIIVLEGEGGGRCERIHGSAKLGVAFAPHARLRGLFASMGGSTCEC
jgi:hypothetical protein